MAVWIRSWAACWLVAACALSAQAQTGSVRGRVVDASTGEPLPGVNVVVRGLSIGAATDLDGRYSLERVPVGEQTIEARFVGYRAQARSVRVQAGQVVTLDFRLEPTALELGEIVVTGAGGPVEKRKLGNSIATIDAAGLREAPIKSFSDLIQGREPGLIALPSSGMTGEGTRIRIRGSASLSQSNEPVVYIDGVRVDNGGGWPGFVGTGGGGSPSRLDDINPEAIERVEILKGAAAATLYGTEASRGVIQIFTRKGVVGPPRLSVQYQQGALFPIKRFPPIVGFARTQAIADTMSKYYGRTIRPYELVADNWPNRLFETGRSASFSASLSGGSPGVTYFLNLRMQDEDGVLTGKNLPYPPGFGPRSNDLLRRIQATSTVNVFPTDRFQIRATAGYTDTRYEVPDNSNSIYAPLSRANFSRPDLVRYNNPTGVSAFATVPEGFQIQISQNARHFNGSIGLNYRPLEGLTLDGTFGADYSATFSQEFWPFGWNINRYSGADIEGLRDVSDRSRLELTLDAKASYRRMLSPRLESFTILGTQSFRTQTLVRSGRGRRFPGPGFEVTGAGAERDAAEFYEEVINAGVFGQQQFGWADFAFLTIGGRYDANSAFGSEFKGVFYPKASLSVVPSDAAFWKPIGPISSLRLRAAVGQSGLQPGAFDALTTFGALASNRGPGVVPLNLGNPRLKPEVSTEWELGLDLGLWRDQLSLQSTYWDRTVRDALIARQFPVSGGFRATQLDNIGKTRARGLDLSLNAVLGIGPQSSVNFFATAAYLWERVISLGGAPPIKAGGSYPRYRNFVIEGYAPGAHFGPKLRPVPADRYPIDTNRDGQPDSRQELLAYLGRLTPSSARLDNLNAFVLLLDEDGDGDYLDHYLGKPLPDWQGTFGFTLTVRGNWRLSALFEYQAGNFYVNNLLYAFRQASSAYRNLPAVAETERDFITGGVDQTYQPQNNPEVRLRALERWLYEFLDLSPFDGLNTIKPADFLRWREFSIAYTVPSRWVSRIGARSLSVSLAARNLWLWTRYNGLDPEVNVIGRGSGGNTRDDNFILGVDYALPPLPRTVLLTVRLGF